MVGRFFHRLRSTRDTELHAKSIVLITAHAPVIEVLPYRDGKNIAVAPVTATWSPFPCFMAE